ncbi:hypothetical protein HanPSC8_Chr17g0752291 [Helianthus annuus]|nr:hypothetical protein HanPSC8_Chr17g0752291 [Helianthus annuus]
MPVDVVVLWQEAAEGKEAAGGKVWSPKRTWQQQENWATTREHGSNKIERLNVIIQDIVKEKEEEKERLNGIGGGKRER